MDYCSLVQIIKIHDNDVFDWWNPAQIHSGENYPKWRNLSKGLSQQPLSERFKVTGHYVNQCWSRCLHDAKWPHLTKMLKGSVKKENTKESQFSGHGAHTWWCMWLTTELIQGLNISDIPIMLEEIFTMFDPNRPVSVGAQTMPLHDRLSRDWPKNYAHIYRHW